MRKKPEPTGPMKEHEFYVLRYRPEVKKLKDRVHSHTEGRWSSWADADDALSAMPERLRETLQVERRTEMVEVES